MRRPASSASSRQTESRSSQHALEREFLLRVYARLSEVEQAPNYKIAKKAARTLGRKIKCSCCKEYKEIRNLSFKQWTADTWTAYCQDCEQGQ